MQQHFHSNGKLLLTAEFLVIDGARALAVPCQYGQSMEVEEIEEPEILFESFTDEGKMWYDGVFSITEEGISNIYGSIYGSSDEKEGERLVSERLEQILNAMLRIKRPFFQNGGFIIKNRLDFPRDWGLGTSSTLLSNMAEWADINPYYLSNASFGGSGYDIACATSNQPILYQRVQAENPLIGNANFDPPFKEELFFVHLNRKQDTREVVKRYKELNPEKRTHWVNEASFLTESFVNCKDRSAFEKLIEAHESLLAKVLDLPTVKRAYFYNYPGAIKSLGAWGGDFILVTGTKEDHKYFEEKGYSTILRYKDLVLNKC